MGTLAHAMVQADIQGERLDCDILYQSQSTHSANGNNLVKGIKNVMEILLAIIGSGALSSIIAGIFSLIQNRKNKKDGVSKGVRQLLYDRIKYLGRCYISDGTISAEDLEDLMQMHGIYHTDLGGNGYLDNLMEQVKHLPIKSK